MAAFLADSIVLAPVAGEFECCPIVRRHAILMGMVRRDVVCQFQTAIGSFAEHFQLRLAQCFELTEMLFGVPEVLIEIAHQNLAGVVADLPQRGDSGSCAS